MSDPGGPALELIRIYPLKSFDGVNVEAVDVLPSGALAWDRRYALFDANGIVLSGKREPRVHGVRIAWKFETPEVLAFMASAVDAGACRGRLPQDAGRLADWFGKYFGQKLALRENVRTGFPDDVEAPGPTVVASASILRVAQWFGESAELTRRRFRANLEVRGVPAFWEDGLLADPGGEAGRLLIGGGVELRGMKACARCPVPTRNPDTGVADAGLPRRFSVQRAAELPPWAPRSRFVNFYRFTLNTDVAPDFGGGRLHVGDACAAAV